VLAGALAHQIGADSIFNDCQRFAPVPLLIVTTICIISSLGGGLASLRAVRMAGGETTSRVVGVISVGFALLVTLAIILPMLAAIILPPCFE
jgi:hypothetical protein